MQAVPTVPPTVAVANLRRSVIIATCLGFASALVLGIFGHVAMGLFACLGLGLGAINTQLVQRSVVAYAASDAGNKKGRFTRSVLGRLAVMTIVALGCALLFRPDGLGVFIGLAVFQMLMLGGASVPVFKQLRQS